MLEGRGRSGMGPADLSPQSWDPVSLQLAQTHGRVFTVWVGRTPLVVLSGFRAVKEALVSNSEQFSGRPLTPFFQDLFGERGKAVFLLQGPGGEPDW